MTRKFTKYPSNYVKANNEYPSDYEDGQFTYINLWAIDFYNMLSDLISLRTVYVKADTKTEAHRLGQQLAVAFGYKPDKITTQFAYITQGQFNNYFYECDENGITYYFEGKLKK